MGWDGVRLDGTGQDLMAWDGWAGIVLSNSIVEKGRVRSKPTGFDCIGLDWLDWAGKEWWMGGVGRESCWKEEGEAG